MTSTRRRTWTAPNGDERTAWLVDYRDQGGRRRSKQFARKKDADAWRVGAEHEVATGVHTAGSESITVAAAADLWIERAERDGRERSTVKSYREIARLHIAPLLGNRRLSALTRPIVEQYRDDLLADRSRAMAGKAVRSLSMILGEAQRRGLVAQNVAKGVRVVRPSRERERVVIPSRAELRAMLKAAAPDERPILMTIIATGIRSSELRGLRWADIDLKRSPVTRAPACGRVGHDRPAEERGRHADDPDPRRTGHRAEGMEAARATQPAGPRLPLGQGNAAKAVQPAAPHVPPVAGEGRRL